MKWLVVLFALFVHGQVTAAGLCIKDNNGEFTNRCIGGWNGATDVVAYGGALAAMLDKFRMVIGFDSYTDDRRWFGYICNFDSGGAPDDDPSYPREPSTGCSYEVPTLSAVNTPQVHAFYYTLKTANKLATKLEQMILPSIKYYYTYGEDGKDSTKVDKARACETTQYHRKMATLWSNFASSFQQDYDAYDDIYRKKIYKHWFQATKRLYGFYANRMKRLLRNIKREYRCEV